jgi:hypothetical protein
MTTSAALTAAKMTKKVRELIEKHTDALETKAALYWSPLIPPDVPPPSEHNRVRFTQGWDFNAFRNAGVAFPAWSTTTGHGSGDYAELLARSERGYVHGGSQNPRALYSTRLLALQALRGAAAEKVGQSLAAIDLQIATEEAASE